MISVTDVVKYCFCPRFTYFEHVLGLQQFEEKRGTVMAGRAMHNRYQKTNTQYVPAGMENAQGITEQKLYSQKYGYVGIVDKAYVMDDKIILVERKNTDYTVVWDSILVQVGLLSYLLEENYQLPVTECHMVFSKTSRTIKKITIDENLRNRSLLMLEEAKNIIKDSIMPDAVFGGKCAHCCYRKVCSVGFLNTEK